MVIESVKLAEVAEVSIDMARKYKSGYSLPPLDTAIKFEDHLQIPVRYWVDIKKKRESKK